MRITPRRSASADRSDLAAVALPSLLLLAGVLLPAGLLRLRPARLPDQAVVRLAPATWAEDDEEAIEDEETDDDASDDGPSAESVRSGPADPEPGRRVRVVLDDGRTYTGTFRGRTRLHVVIAIAGIDTKFDSTVVDEIVPLRTFEEHYETMRQVIPRDDYDERYDFCRWIHGRGRLVLAAEELEALLDDAPAHEGARRLLEQVTAEIAMRSRAEDIRGRRSGDAAGPAGRTVDADGRLLPTRLLSDEEVHLLKVYEIDLENPPRLIIPRSVIDDLLEEYAGHPLLPRSEQGRRMFYRRSYAEIADLIFRLQARDYYDDIQVLSEPEAFNRFRLDVHRTWLRNGCATSRCHGGTEAGSLFLFGRRAHDDNVVYTNFLILERTRIDDRPLLDYDDPESSLLLQMGLPRFRSTDPHPEVDGWRPVFTDHVDPLFTKAVAWMNAMYRPRPDYPIDYELPEIEYESERPWYEQRGEPVADDEEAESDESAGGGSWWERRDGDTRTESGEGEGPDRQERDDGGSGPETTDDGEDEGEEESGDGGADR